MANLKDLELARGTGFQLLGSLCLQIVEEMLVNERNHFKAQNENRNSFIRFLSKRNVSSGDSQMEKFIEKKTIFWKICNSGII